MATQERLLARVLASERDKVRSMRDIAIELHGALERLAAGGTRLESGTRRLAGKGEELKGGLEQLSSAAHRLSDGLAALQRRRRGAAARALERLPAAPTRCSAGSGGPGSASALPRRPSPAAPRELRRRSPHLFDSGYFVLSAIDGAPPVPRGLAGEAVNVDAGARRRGCSSSRPIPSTPPARGPPASSSRTKLQRLAREGDLVTGVSGGAAILNDYGSATKSRLPLVIGAIVLITFLMLVAILRAPLLAALAVCLNLASVAAAVGVVSLICKIPAGYPLGGHSYIDTVGAAGIFGVTFGLSIDYAVFLLARMRERRDAGADNARRDRLRAREDRRGDHRRGRDHGGRLRLLRRRADRHREPARGRADGGDPARRDGGPDRPAAGADAAAWRSGLACAHRSSAAAAAF